MYDYQNFSKITIYSMMSLLLQVTYHTAYLDVRELAQVSIHGDESMINQLLVVVSPQHITVLQHGWTLQNHTRSQTHNVRD